MDGYGNQTPRGGATPRSGGGTAFSIMFDKPKGGFGGGAPLSARGAPLSARRRAMGDTSSASLHDDPRPASKKSSFKFLKKDAGHKAYDAHADASMLSESGTTPHRTSSAILESRALREAIAADMREGKVKDPFADMVIAVPKRGALSKEELRAIQESQDAAAEAARIVASGGTLPPPTSRKPAPKVKKLNNSSMKPAWNSDLTPMVESAGSSTAGNSPVNMDPPAQHQAPPHSHRQQPQQQHRNQQQPLSVPTKKTSVLDDYDGGLDVSGGYPTQGDVEYDSEYDDEPWRGDEDVDDEDAHDNNDYGDEDEDHVGTTYDNDVRSFGDERNPELLQTIRPVPRKERHRQARQARGEAEPEGYGSEDDEAAGEVHEGDDGHQYQRAPNSARVRFEVNKDGTEREIGSASDPLSRTAPANNSSKSLSSSRQQAPPSIRGSTGNLRSNALLGSSNTTAGQSPSARNRNFFGGQSPEGKPSSAARPQTAHPSRRPAAPPVSKDYGDEEEQEYVDDYRGVDDQDDYDPDFYGSSQPSRGSNNNRSGGARPGSAPAQRHQHQRPAVPSPVRGGRGSAGPDEVQEELMQALEEEREATRLERLECQRMRMALDKDRERFRRQRQQEEDKLHLDREELEAKIEEESRTAKRDQRVAEDRVKALRADLQAEKESVRRLRDENEGLREQLDKALAQMRNMEKKHRMEVEKMRVDVATLTARNTELMDMTKASQTALLQAQQQHLQQQASVRGGGATKKDVTAATSSHNSSRFRDPYITGKSKTIAYSNPNVDAPYDEEAEEVGDDDGDDQATYEDDGEEEGMESDARNWKGRSNNAASKPQGGGGGGGGRQQQQHHLQDTRSSSADEDYAGGDDVLTNKRASADAARQQIRERRAKEIEARLEREDKERRERKDLTKQKRDEERERKELQQQQQEEEERRFRDQMAAAAKTKLRTGSGSVGTAGSATPRGGNPDSSTVATGRPPLVAPSITTTTATAPLVNTVGSTVPPRGLPPTIPTMEQLVYDGEPDADENIPDDCVTSQRLTGAGNNKKEVTYRSGKREVHYSNNTIKTVLPSGHTILRFSNGDIKTTYPSGKSTYWYDSAQTTHTQLANNIEIFQFHSTQQTERHYPNGTKEILYPEGIYKLMRVDGSEESMFPDGTTHRT